MADRWYPADRPTLVASFCISTPTMPLKLTLSIAFFLVWLLQAFLFGNSRGYLILISIYFGVIALSTGLSYLLSDPSVWRTFLVIFPGLSFYPAFSPIGMVLHVDGVVPLFLFLAAVYALLFGTHRLGKYKLKE